MLGLGLSIPRCAVRAGDALTREVASILAKYGTDAHVYLPGIGVINGLTAGNWLDSGGTTPATVDNPVGKADDAAGAIDATQATTANKPILRRGLVNLLPYSKDISTGWTKSNCTTPDANTLLETSANAAHYVTSLTSTLISSATYTVAARVKSIGGREAVEIQYGNGSQAVRINLSTNAVIASVGVSNIQVGTSDSNGYKLITFQSSTAATSVPILVVSSLNNTGGGGITFLGDITKGVSVSEIGVFAGVVAPSDITFATTTTAAASSATGNYKWEFDGSNDSLALGSVPFQMADDHCVIAGINANYSLGKSAVSIANSGSTVQYCARIRSSAPTQLTVDWRDNAAVAVAHQVTVTNNTPYVISARHSSGVRDVRKNGVQVGTSSTVLGATTLNTATIGGFISSSPSYWNGTIYPVIFIKGTVTDADMLILEKWVGSLSGVTI